MRAHVAAGRSQPPTNTPRIRRSNDPEITGTKLASKVMSALFALKLQSGTTATTTEGILLAVCSCKV